MTIVFATVFMPLLGALLLLLFRRLSWSGWVNVVVSVATFVAALTLAIAVARHGVVSGASFRIDAFNVYLLALTAFVGMTTSIFSRPYMRYVCDTGKTSAEYNQSTAIETLIDTELPITGFF